MRTCDNCGVEKAESHFRKFGRGLKKLCKACEGLEEGERTIAAREPKPVKIEAALEVPAGLGFRASLEDGLLQIEQDRVADDGETYTHELALSRHEAARLVDWIAEQVGETE